MNKILINTNYKYTHTFTYTLVEISLIIRKIFDTGTVRYRTVVDRFHIIVLTFWRSRLWHTKIVLRFGGNAPSSKLIPNLKSGTYQQWLYPVD